MIYFIYYSIYLKIKLKGGNNIKKAAIITIYSRLNYGNRFQNYAVQEILKETIKAKEFLNNYIN